MIPRTLLSSAHLHQLLHLPALYSDKDVNRMQGNGSIFGTENINQNNFCFSHFFWTSHIAHLSRGALTNYIITESISQFTLINFHRLISAVDICILSCYSRLTLCLWGWLKRNLWLDVGWSIGFVIMILLSNKFIEMASRSTRFYSRPTTIDIMCV